MADDEIFQSHRRQLFAVAYRMLGSASDAEDVVQEGFWSDGGGKVLAARRPVFGRESVVSVLVGIRRTAPSQGLTIDRVSLDIVGINEEPALVLRVDGRVDSVYTMTIVGGAIAAIRIVRNPDKLRFLERQLALM